jgi:transcriptional regulator with XRE-family HTH domain
MRLDDIKSKREKMGLSQRAFAQFAGMSPAYLSRIERGEVVPTKRTIDKIQKVFTLQEQNITIANYYIQPSVAAEDRGRAIAAFIHLLDRVCFEAGEKKEKEIIAAVLGFMEALELVALSSPISDGEIMGCMTEAYYTYAKKQPPKNTGDTEDNEENSRQ